MKKIITLALILLPLAAIAQNGNMSVKKFFDKYCESPNYSSIEITEDMFKMFGEMEDADSEMIPFLKKLKYVRFMEYEENNNILAVGVSSGTNSSNYYIDGEERTVTTVKTSKGKKESTIATNTTPILTARSSLVYSRAVKEINLMHYTQLMKSNQDGEKLLFLRRQYTTNPNDQEFILLNGNTLIQIRGDINIRHLYEMDEILEMIGDILPL